MEPFPLSVRYAFECNNPNLIDNNQPLQVDLTVEMLPH